jgi:hypothetical protein
MPYKMEFTNSLSINPLAEEKHPKTHFIIHEEDFSFTHSYQQKKFSPVVKETNELSVIKASNEASCKLPSVDESLEKVIIQNFPKTTATMGAHLRDMKNEAKQSKVLF